jgi:hypothetical protein
VSVPTDSTHGRWWADSWEGTWRESSCILAVCRRCRCASGPAVADRPTGAWRSSRPAKLESRRQDCAGQCRQDKALVDGVDRMLRQYGQPAVEVKAAGSGGSTRLEGKAEVISGSVPPNRAQAAWDDAATALDPPPMTFGGHEDSSPRSPVSGTCLRTIDEGADEMTDSAWHGRGQPQQSGLPAEIDRRVAYEHPVCRPWSHPTRETDPDRTLRRD